MNSAVAKRIFFEFKDSIRRIFLFLYALVFAFSSPRISDKPTSLSPKDEYIESRKKRFLATFENAGETEPDWNSNIEPIFSDATALSEIMKEPNNEVEKKWRTRILIENTPRGNVIMFYDAYKRGFSYYCDSTVMPYDIMNAVAMKYVLTFFCRDFFVDSAVLPKKTEDQSQKDTANEKTEENKKTNTVQTDKQAFVKFKTYNTATKKAGIKEENDKVINCFMHLGASRNWMPITKTAKLNPINGFQTDMIPSNRKLSYLEYKNMKG
jgi:hypothetical protein